MWSDCGNCGLSLEDVFSTEIYVFSVINETAHSMFKVTISLSLTFPKLNIKAVFLKGTVHPKSPRASKM